jgi:hypothetical protein
MQASARRTGKRDEPQDFLKFLQYEQIPAYVIVKAGLLKCLLKNIEAESGRKETFMRQQTI